jgi:hypothetical protein
MTKIPPLDHRSLLPEGRFITNLMAIAEMFCTDLYRNRMWSNFLVFLDFLRKEQPEMNCPLALSGSFFSDKLEPDDIDCAILADHDTDPRLGWAFLIWYKNNRDAIKDKYKVHFLYSIPGGNDIVSYLEYVGPKTAEAKALHEKDRRGILVVESW